jgi:hypothetical protein
VEKRSSIPIYFLILLFLLFSPALAQISIDSPLNIRTINAVPAGEIPVLDGLLNDTCWTTADWQGDFIQLKPSPGEPARAQTRVAIVFDHKHLFVAFRCFNPTGNSANSKITARDGNMDLDNAVTLYLDTFHSRRDCYYFSTNSIGTQIEGRIGEDGNSNDKSWDCIWFVKSREDSLGWTAEMAIPVSEIRIPEGENRIWGINFRRNYPEYFETSFWVERDAPWRISRSGDLRGLGTFSKVFSASLLPYAVYLNSNSPSSGRKKIYSSGNSEAIFGADLTFKFGATVNGNVTYNPDFATVEADLSVINLTRYETFYPEKRLYFLEGAELFKSHFNVFHSRRIGEMDIGLKTNGRLGDYNFAVLSARERDLRNDPSAQTSVVRVQRDILKSSTIGFIAVDRSTTGDYNRVMSADATINLPDGSRIISQFVGSTAHDEDPESAFFLEYSRQAPLYNYLINVTSIDPGFRNNVNPVGFITDDDRREIQANGGNEIWIRKFGIDKINTNLHNDTFWNYRGDLRNLETGGWVGITFLDKWLLGFGKTWHTEVFEKRFHNDVSLWESGYNMRSWNSISTLHQWGRNFDADFQKFRLRVNLKPSSRLSLSQEYNYLEVSPDPRKQSTQNYLLTTDYNFTPDLWLRFITQYSSRNDRVYAYGLWGWRFAPPFGALYLAYTADRYDDPLDAAPSEKQHTLFLKLTVPLSLK